MTNAHEAKVTARSLPVSTKHVIEISNYIRGKNVQKSKEFLERVITKKSALPMNRYRSAGHRKGKIGPGRYPQKATKEVLRLLKSLEANAQNKGLDTATLYIKTIIPNVGETIPRYGRNRGQAKRTHLEIIAEEAETIKTTRKKETKKTEEKK